VPSMCSLNKNMAETLDFNVFVGAETGLFKGVNVNNKQIIAKNLNSLQLLDREQEITCMAWGNENESEILMGLRCQKVRIYDTEFKAFSGCVEVPLGTGPIRGVGKIDGAIVTAAESGHVKLWRFKGSEQVEINALTTGELLSKMRVSPYTPNVIATGGKKSALQLWDLSTSKSVFKAKNVRNDFLDMPVPIWDSDMAFVPNSEQVVTCSRHGQVRLYDPKAGQRRPIATALPEEESWTCIGVTSRPNQVVVGSGKGRMVLFDFRQQKVIHAYRGFTGGIRELACHPTSPFVASVGLDRFLRVHHFDQQAPVFRSYLKSRLNTLLMRKDFRIDLPDDDVQLEQKAGVEDPLWNTMEVISDDKIVPRKIRKRKV